MASNFELTINLTDRFTLAHAKEYFHSLEDKIKTEELTQIIFKASNDFFLPNLEKSLVPN